MATTFSYAEVEDVAPLLKSGLTETKREMLQQQLTVLSSKLSGLFPGLRQVWLAEEEDSDLKNFVTSMIINAARDFINNPEGMASETIGVFAYSRFDSNGNSPFSREDLAALRDMLDSVLGKQVGSFKMNLGPTMYPAAPMPTPFTYSNTRSDRSWRR